MVINEHKYSMIKATNIVVMVENLNFSNKMHIGSLKISLALDL